MLIPSSILSIHHCLCIVITVTVLHGSPFMGTDTECIAWAFKGGAGAFSYSTAAAASCTTRVGFSSLPFLILTSLAASSSPQTVFHLKRVHELLATLAGDMLACFRLTAAAASCTTGTGSSSCHSSSSPPLLPACSGPLSTCFGGACGALGHPEPNQP